MYYYKKSKLAYDPFLPDHIPLNMANIKLYTPRDSETAVTLDGICILTYGDFKKEIGSIIKRNGVVSKVIEERK